ncbi:KTSC domain-containing protein [Epilithonimonas zeae]|uniref:KTSC domain-containing protein n=1 Tax=Epilithonimonas zeae TaxID=1416779 RepID=UPI00200D62B1|nr:KTSC domain-containing protein [Epilithonimonas zeae]UQB68242.1 KTSC domain-containing protein [Epilithonimonas zeae]
MPSSVVNNYNYLEDKKILRIVYQSGAVYDYLNVSQKIFDEFKSAFSKGIYLNKVIKPKFKFKKISD